ncbi:MAG TPA: aldehyde dehydrogenase family protein, partial [Polyangia bacterium]|nr:aldehyde dehydrogenase family protein [Polyangia bacterium]
MIEFRGNVQLGMDEARIQEIVDRVMARVGELPETPLEAVRTPPAGFVPPPAPPSSPSSSPLPARRRDVDVPRGRRGVFADVESAVKAARRAHEENEAAPLEARKRWVEAMRATARAHVDELAKLAVAETGYGRVADKLKKNRLAIDKTPGTEALG